MPFLKLNDVSLRYEDYGSGAPLLVLAPGGLNSTIEMWPRVAIDPIQAYGSDYRIVAMDQRNAGASTGPFAVDDPWGSYIEDQLAVMNALGIDRFMVMGCCIGCSYALKLIEAAPDRIIAAVLEQPIGVVEENVSLWKQSYTDWVANLVATRPDLTEADGLAFSRNMWEGEFVLSVSREFVASCQTPLAVLPGIDLPHPHSIGREVVELAPNVVDIDPWKETPELIAAATQRIAEFLAAHASD